MHRLAAPARPHASAPIVDRTQHGVEVLRLGVSVFAVARDASNVANRGPAMTLVFANFVAIRPTISYSGIYHDSAGGPLLSSTEFLSFRAAAPQLRRGRAMPHSTRLLLARSLVVVAAALVAASCDSATSPIDQSQAPVLTTVTPVWDSNFDSYTNQEVTSLPAVIVRDQFGHVMAGVRVSFAVTAGGGTLGFPETVTSADGIAKLVRWTLGPLAGENIVVATVSQKFKVSFRLVSKPAPDNGDPCNGCWDY